MLIRAGTQNTKTLMSRYCEQNKETCVVASSVDCFFFFHYELEHLDSDWPHFSVGFPLRHYGPP